MLSETVLLTIGLGCVAALLGVALFGAMKREFKRISAAFGAVPTVVNTNVDRLFRFLIYYLQVFGDPGGSIRWPFIDF